MLLPKSKLLTYIPADSTYWFTTRNGADPVLCRNAYFEAHPTELTEGRYCAVGEDTNGYQLEQYLNQNWITVNPNSNYNLTITNRGLKALADAQNGGYRLYVSGLKIRSDVITQPVTEVINWTDNEFQNTGDVVFSASAGTNSYWASTEQPGVAYNPAFKKQGVLNEMLTWDFNSSNGGLQYTLTLSPDNAGDVDDFDNSEWYIGSIGIYVRAQNQETKRDNSNTATGVDILFGVATLQKPVQKLASTVDRFGNKLIFYFNVILNNLGYVTNLEVMPQETCRVPEVANEAIIENMANTDLNSRNLYLVANSHGTNIPALALPRGENEDHEKIWSYVYPTDSFIRLTSADFASDVTNYRFVCWDAAERKYVLASGQTATPSDNDKMPVGLRIGNSIVFSGEIINNTDCHSYSYTVHSFTESTAAKSPKPGISYKENDLLLLPHVTNSVTDITFKIRVLSTDQSSGAIKTFKFLGPNVGNVPVNTQIYAVYSPYSQYPQYGEGAQFNITNTEIENNGWNFSDNDINKPLYCDGNGMPTTTVTDVFVGWCTGHNSLKLALDLRNEATLTRYGTTRYATQDEVRRSVELSNAAVTTSLTPSTAKQNYLQITKGNAGSDAQAGDTLANPIRVNTFTKFNEVIIGKGITEPFNESTNPHITDSSISFYGMSFRSWWQDLAEFYEADKYYEPGTLITMGAGEKEITLAVNECNGIISEKPGYQLGTKKSEHSLPVALVGRVFVKLDGECFAKFGDKIYLSKVKPGYASTVENGKCLGKIIQKNAEKLRYVECSVRIDF